MSLNSLSEEKLISGIEELVRSERKITAQVLEYIREIDRRKIYLKFATSMFGYLTQKLGYTPGAAQRRIDAARLSAELPEIKVEIQAGSLNLSQVSMLAQNLKQKQKEDSSFQITPEKKRELLESVKKQDLVSTEKVFAQALDLKVQNFEKKHFQKDSSVRMEITLTEGQFRKLERVKEVLSHTHAGASVAEIFDHLASEFLKRKDPLLRKGRPSNKTKLDAQKDPQTKTRMSDSVAEFHPKESAASTKITYPGRKPLFKRPPISARDRRATFKRDQCCQWRDPLTGKVCGSRFQPQVDHVVSVWRGGLSTPENLQQLCSVHNLLKYACEINSHNASSRPSSKTIYE